jgi:hypothetical protein
MGRVWRLTGTPVRKGLKVTICLDCALSNHSFDYSIAEKRQRKCETCRREIRFCGLSFTSGPGTCCHACQRLAQNERNKQPVASWNLGRIRFRWRSR